MGADVDSRSPRGPSTTPTAARSRLLHPAAGLHDDSTEHSAPSRSSTSGARGADSPPPTGSSTPPGTSDRAEPDLTLVYLPHLDYDPQRFGPTPGAAQAAADVDAASAPLLDDARPGRDVVAAQRVRHHRGRPPRRHQPRPAPRRPARRAHAGRPASYLDPDLPRLRRRRPPARPRLRRATPRDLAASASLLRRPGRHRRGARREGKAAYGLDHPRAGDWCRRRARRLVHLPLLARRRAARPTSPAPSTSTASPATTLSSCSSTPTTAASRLRVPGAGSQEARLALPS